MKEKTKRIIEKIKDIFSLHCPECGGRMKSEYLDMEIDKLVYKCKKMWKGMGIMQLFEDLVKCKDCMNNINSKCMLYPGKDVKEENTGCYVGIDRNNKQKILGGVLSERK